MADNKSILTAEPKTLLNQINFNANTWKAVGTNSRGMPILKFDKMVGNVIGSTGQNLGPTPYVTVHVNSRGQVHFVPILR